MLRLIQKIKTEMEHIAHQIKYEEKIIKAKKSSKQAVKKAVARKKKLQQALEDVERVLRNGLM